MTSTSSASTSTAWQHLWEQAQPRLHAIQGSLESSQPVPPRIIRVGQLDAELLDQELVQLLQEPITKALSFIDSSLKGRYQAELTLLIQLTLYKFSVWDSSASYGAKLQGLMYATGSSGVSSLSLRTLLFHGSLTMLVPYLHTRIRAYALSNAWPDAPSSDRRRKAWEMLTRLESAHSLLALLNFVSFLWNGRYRTVSDRLLQMQLISARRLSKREVSYEFMNRQMVWHAFTEFLLFLLPLVKTKALRRYLAQLTSQLTLSSLLPAPVRALAGIQPSGKDVLSGRSRKGKYYSLPLDQCAICHADASTSSNIADASNSLTSFATSSYSSTNKEPPLESDNAEEDPPTHPIHTPYVTSCGHTYCYVCITGRLMRTADDRSGIGPGGTHWECLRCNEGVSSADRIEMELEEGSASDSEFGSTSISGMEYEDGSDDLTFTDMSGSMGTYSDNGSSE